MATGSEVSDEAFEDQRPPEHDSGEHDNFRSLLKVSEAAVEELGKSTVQIGSKASDGY